MIAAYNAGITARDKADGIKMTSCRSVDNATKWVKAQAGVTDREVEGEAEDGIRKATE